MRKSTAFTLVELLVVVTIIVVLLAMLLPAMGTAIYQANLALCATNQRLTANAAIQYAVNARSFYPPRPRTTNSGGLQAWAVHLPANADGPAFDMKPMLRTKLGLDPNIAFQCPLITPIDLDERLPDEAVYGNTACHKPIEMSPFPTSRNVPMLWHGNNDYESQGTSSAGVDEPRE